MKVNEIISYVNNEEIDKNVKDEIKTYLETNNGKILARFLKSLKVSTIPLKSNLSCKHNIDEIVLYKQKELEEEHISIVENRILSCDSCFNLLQILLDYDKLEKNSQNDNKQDEINIINIKEQKDSKLLKKIFAPYFIYGFSSGVAVAIIILIFILPSKNIDEVSQNNNFINQMSSNKINSQEILLLKEAIKLFEDNKIDDSIEKLEQMVQKNTSISETYYYLALCYEKKNDKETSKRILKKYLDIISKEKDIIDKRIQEVKNKINED